jgi:hypothetical protein
MHGAQGKDKERKLHKGVSFLAISEQLIHNEHNPALAPVRSTVEFRVPTRSVPRTDTSGDGTNSALRRAIYESFAFLP